MYVECMNVESNAFAWQNERTEKQFPAEHVMPPFFLRGLCMCSRVSMIAFVCFCVERKMNYWFPAPLIHLVNLNVFYSHLSCSGWLREGRLYVCMIYSNSDVTCVFHYLPILLAVPSMMVDRGSTVVKVLRYKSEGRWFDSALCQ